MTGNHQQAREAAAIIAFPDQGYGKWQDRNWGSRIQAERRNRYTKPKGPGHYIPPYRHQFTAHLTNPDWQNEANCAGADTEIFFPERHENNLTHKAAIQAICGPCPVRTECLHSAIGNGEKYGWWGGMSPKQRTRHAKGQS